MFNTILVHPLFNLLALIYAVVPGHDFGLAVIILTVAIRLLLWPVVTKQLHSQKAMQELSPEIAKVRAKAKGDKQLESKLLMELYKEKEISPFASLIPLIVQLPLLLALFVVLRNIIKPGEIAQLAYGPIKQLAAIKEILANSDVFKPTLFGIVNLARPSVWLALIAAGTQYFQAKQLAPQAAADPSTRAITSVTTLAFPILTGAIALSLPAALPLYWIVTSGIAIFQQKLILQQDVEEMEGKGKSK